MTLRPIFGALIVLALSASTVSAGFADLIVANARVRTIDASRPGADAFAVSDGRFTFVGSADQAFKFRGPDTRVIDAAGRTVLPGFNDSHVHLVNVGARLFAIDSGSERDLIAAVRFRVGFLEKTDWITGGGWTAANLPPRSALDSAAPDNPVLLYGRDPASAAVNSAALKRAGIDSPNYPISGAELERVRRFVPPAPDKASVLQAAMRYAAAFGVTSVQDVSSDDLGDELRRLEESGKLLLRVYDCVGIDSPPPNVDRRPDSMIRTGCVKHYSEGDRTEIPILSRRLGALDRRGVQLLLHAIGPRANAAALSVVERITQTNGKSDRRLRIEHAHNFAPRDLVRFTRIPVIASMQPALFDNGSADYSPMFSLMKTARVALAFGSDASMIPIDPMSGIRSATRDGGLDFENAVRAYTLGAAYAEFQERDKGSVTRGKLADFVILNDGVTGIGSVFVGGRLVYEAPVMR